MIKKIPNYIIEILRELEKAGYEAYIVGGCVRDLLLEKDPKDWDITTNAKPEEVMKLFETFGGGTKESPGAFYENAFGTVGVKAPTRGLMRTETRTNAEKVQRESALSQQKSALDVVEITTFRIESKYSDKRRPDEVKFAKTLEEDLSRRDFTMNAVALRITNFTKLRTKKNNNFEIIDLFEGQKDIKNKIIRAVGDPDERFDEDALRMMRAVRFASQLNGNTQPRKATPRGKHITHNETLN